MGTSDSRGNPATDIQNRKLASAATVKSHAALREYVGRPDCIPSHPRGMALIDKIDTLIAADELTNAKGYHAETQSESAKLAVNAAQLKVVSTQERIDQRMSAIPQYATFMDDVEKLVTHLKGVVEQYNVSDKENIPFYRLLKEEVMRKSS